MRLIPYLAPKLPFLVVALALPVTLVASADDYDGYYDFMIGERPVVEEHLEEVSADDNFSCVFEHGDLLFEARFNKLDGQGRPASTGTGANRMPIPATGLTGFARVSSPDSNACASCHLDPIDGGAGDFTTGVYVLAQAADPLVDLEPLVNEQFGNYRNTTPMQGTGAIEMISREMTQDLHDIRDAAAAQADATNEPVTSELVTKGVHFGYITVMPDGTVDPSQIEGVDWDLIIKPFHQKGAVVSLRQFTNNAMNHHHGMQSIERFGANMDPDIDGMDNELLDGDITATTIYQAALETPTRSFPKDYARRFAAYYGRYYFKKIGCNDCHKTSLPLNDPYFVEPNPFNPPGNGGQDMEPYVFDMTKTGRGKRLRKSKSGIIHVRALTDLKRHNLCDATYDYFCNEQVPQGTLAGFETDPNAFTISPAPPRPTEEFLTSRLWHVGNTDPYGHRGDLTTMTEAIYYHGGEARASRDAFFALSEKGQGSIIEYLKTFVIVPSEKLVGAGPCRSEKPGKPGRGHGRHGHAHD